MSKKSAGSLFDRAFADLLRESTESLDGYDPNTYTANQVEDDEEAWGDINTKVTYQEEEVFPIKYTQPAPSEPLPDTPKTSKIAQKYFNIKSQPPQLPKPANPQPKQPRVEQLVESKINELNSEVEKFKKENDQLKRVKIQFEELQRSYMKQTQEHEKEKQEFVEQVRKTIEEEKEKIAKETKLRERNQKLMANLPGKKERDELEYLKNEYAKYQEQNKVRDSKYKANKERLVRQLQEAKERKEALQEQLNSLQSTTESFPQPNKDTPQQDSTFQNLESVLPPSTSQVPLNSQKSLADGSVVKYYDSGHYEVLFPNGTRKEVYPNGYSVIFHVNEDVKQVFSNGKVVYFYANENTTHTSLPEGLQIIRFSNGQVEKHYSDGSKKIKYVDGAVKLVKATGEEEIIYPDSTREEFKSDCRVVHHPGGHKEYIWNSGQVTREFYVS